MQEMGGFEGHKWIIPQRYLLITLLCMGGHCGRGAGVRTVHDAAAPRRLNIGIGLESPPRPRLGD